MSFNSDTTIRRRRASALQRRRPNNSAGRGFLYRRQRNDGIPGGSLPIKPDDSEAITITQVRTLSTASTSTTSSRTTSTTSRATTTRSTSASSSSSSISSSPSVTTSDPILTATQDTPSASVISPTPTGSTAGSNTPDSSVRNGSGLSSGAIAGIAITVVVVLAALVAYLVRRRMIASRAERKGDWYGRGEFPGPSPPTMAQATFNPAPPSSAYVFGSGAVTTATATPAYSQPPSPPPPVPFATSDRPLSLIPGRRGSDFSPAAVPFQSQPSAVPIAVPIAVPMAPPAAATVPPGPKTRTVRCTFVPSMADELSISTGETIRVLQEYDDGWALCLNQQGSQGMVPLECLDDDAPSGWLGGDRPGLQRASSLSGQSRA